MKVLVTGGHLSPAVAVIDELMSRGHDVRYVGPAFETEEQLLVSDEYPAMKQRGITYVSLETGKWHRYSKMAAMWSMTKLPGAIVRARGIIREYGPDVVFSLGSYLGPPVVYAAKISGVPSVIHEQTHFAGLGNKWSARMADVVAVSFEDTRDYFPEAKVEYTGNPVRLASLEVRETLPGLETLNKKLPTVYVTGGHLGMKNVNMYLLERLEDYLEHCNIIHSIGTHPMQDEVITVAESVGGDVKLDGGAYIWARYFGPDVIGSIFEAADMVVSRSGANTCTELAHWRMPSLLLPLQWGHKQDQALNAEMLHTVGLAEIVDHDSLSVDRLYDDFVEMLVSRDRYTIGDDDLERLYPLDAAERLVEILERYI